MLAIKKVLIIDDDADFRLLLKVRLKSLYVELTVDEYDILTVGDFPSEAECSSYDAIFLDQNLKGEDSGIIWYQGCRKREGFPATIVLTSMGNRTSAIHALNSGVHYYLMKQNLSEEALAQAIEHALKTRDERLAIASRCQ